MASELPSRVTYTHTPKENISNQNTTLIFDQINFSSFDWFIEKQSNKNRCWFVEDLCLLTLTRYSLVRVVCLLSLFFCVRNSRKWARTRENQRPQLHSWKIVCTQEKRSINDSFFFSSSFFSSSSSRGRTHHSFCW